MRWILSGFALVIVVVGVGIFGGFGLLAGTH
jgi:hypothetical protein